MLRAVVVEPTSAGARETRARRTAQVALAAALLVPVQTLARESAPPAHCRTLAAEARSAADLLRAPRVEVQAVRAPQAGGQELGAVAGTSGSQLRAGLSFSPVDWLRGRRVLATADAECERWVAEDALQRLVQQGAAYGHDDALRARIAALEAALPRADALVAEAARRLERGIDSVLDHDELQARRLALDTSLGELRDELSFLEAEGAVAVDAPPAQTLARYEAAVRASEGEKSSERRLRAWQLELRAGAIPLPGPDWYAMVSVGWSAGAVGQARAEDDALRARDDELRTGDHEIRSLLGRFVSAMRASVGRLREELGRVDARLAVCRERLEADRGDSERLRRVLALVEMERLDLESRRAYVLRLIERREPLAEVDP